MKRSLFLKIFAGYLVIVFALSVLILAFAFHTIRDHYTETLTGTLTNFTEAAKPQVLGLLMGGRLQELNSLARTLEKNTNTRITVINAAGMVLTDSDEDPRMMENHKNRIEVSEALTGKIGKSVRYSSTAKREMLYVALPLEKEGRIVGVLRASIFLEQIDTLVAKVNRRIVQITFVIALLSVFAAALIARHLSRPIKELAAAARRVAEKDFSARVFLKQDDELKELADNFNAMNAEMSSLFTELTGQKEELDSLIHSLQEGFLVLDTQGRIIHSNESLAKILQADLPAGSFYWEIMPGPDLTAVIEKARGGKRNFIQEIEVNSRIYRCSATYLASRDEIIAVLHDITDIRGLEKVKRDFVQNVSHELRTPLTAIKGYVETLEEEIDEQHKPYLQVVKRNTDRLIHIVQDLLLLSRLEEEAVRLEPEDVDLAAVIDNALSIFEGRAREKNIRLIREIEGGIPLIRADGYKLEQMFINLFDNAIKYTDRGEVAVSVRGQDSLVRIEVRDTGIGILRQDIPRIFERFYVVDKSRSKKTGGTGLGLSIVKHIVLLHNGTIDVESAPGMGTRFIITLPVEQA